MFHVLLREFCLSYYCGKGVAVEGNHEDNGFTHLAALDWMVYKIIHNVADCINFGRFGFHGMEIHRL